MRSSFGISLYLWDDVEAGVRKLEHSGKRTSSKKVIYREMKLCTRRSQSETRWVILVFPSHLQHVTGEFTSEYTVSGNKIYGFREQENPRQLKEVKGNSKSIEMQK